MSQLADVYHVDSLGSFSSWSLGIQSNAEAKLLSSGSILHVYIGKLTANIVLCRRDREKGHRHAEDT